MLQAGFRQREPRVKVVVPCRMNHDGRWTDACIHNISSRGMLIAADGGLKAGDYVDIRRGALVIIGRVMWSKDRFVGVRTQDRISVDAVVGEPRRASAPGRPEERRMSSRRAAEARAARRVEHSRQIASAMQYGALACGAVAVAWVAASQVHDLLDRPFGLVEAAISGHPSAPTSAAPVTTGID